METLTKPSGVMDAEEQKQLNEPSIALLQEWLDAARSKALTKEDRIEAEQYLQTLMQNLNEPRQASGERLHFPDVLYDTSLEGTS